ncbi:MAG: hypothetical protein QOG25_3866 [Acetobacteraceae bacterium]|jgi:hypothetical protein|nr:hypothetical protein [Acetobacteraceae bacterium]
MTRAREWLAASYQWMTAQQVFSGLASVLIASFVLWTTGVLVNRSELATAPICVRLPKLFQDQNVSVYLRHVRDGVGSAKAGERLLNEDRTMTTSIDTSEPSMPLKACTAVTYTEKMGFQYKVFLKFKGRRPSEVKKILDDNGFNNCQVPDNECVQAEDSQDRTWVLFPAPADRIQDGLIWNNWFPP